MLKQLHHIALAGLVLLLVLVPGSRALAFMDTEQAWNDMLQWGLEKVNTPGQLEIKIGRISSPLDGQVELNDFAIADGGGPWLTAEKVIMAWSPSSLLLGDIEIDDVEIIRPQILRAPDQGPADPETANADPDETRGPLIGWPRLPVNFEIKKLRIQDGFMASGVLAQSFRFDATGAVKDWGDEQSLSLDLKRQDRPGDKLVVAFAHLFEADTLAISVDATEDTNGLVATTLGLPDPQPLSLKLTGDGPLSDWAATLIGSAADYGKAEAKLAASFEAPLSLAVDANLVPGPAVAGAYRQAVGQDAGLIIRLTEDAEGLITLSQMELSSAFAELSASGKMNRNTEEISGQFKTRVREPDLLRNLTDALSFDDLSGEGSISGTIGVPRIAFQADIVKPVTETGSADRVTLTIDANREQTDGPLKLAGNVEIVEPDLGTHVPREAMGPRVSAELAAKVDDGIVHFDRLKLTMAAAQLASTGVLDLSAASFSGEVTADVFNLGAILPDDLPVADGKGTLSLDILQATSAGLFTGGLNANLSALDYTDDRIAQILGPDIRLSGAINASPEGDLRFTNFALTAHEVSAKLDGTVLPQSGAFDIRLDAHISEIAPFTDLAGLQLSGPAAMKGGIAWQPDEALTLRSFTARLASLEFTGDGRLEARGGSALNYTLNIDDLRPFSGLAESPLRGSARISGTASGRLASPDLALDAALQRLSAGNQFVGTVKASLNAANSLDAPQGQLRATINGPYGPGNIDLDFESTNAGDLKLSNLSARLLGLSTRGALTFPGGRLPASGKLNMTIATLSPLGKLAGLALTGSGAGSIDLQGTSGRQQVSTQLDLRQLEAAIGAPPVKFDEFHLSADIGDALGRPRVTSRIELIRGEAFGTPLREVVFTSEGPVDNLRLTTRMRGGRFGTDKVDLAATLKRKGRTQTLWLERFVARYKDRDFRANAPFGVDITGASMNARDIDLDLNGGRLAGYVTYGPRLIETALRLTAIPADLANLARPGLVSSGELTGTIQLKAQPGKGSGSVKLDLNDVQTSDLQTDIPFHLRLGGDWNGQQLDIDARIDGPLEDPLTSTAQIPLRAGGRSALPVLDKTGPLAARINWQGDLEKLSQAIPLGNHLIRGDGVIDVEISGTLNNIGTSGGLSIMNGAYENLIAGTVLTGLTASLTTQDANSIEFDLKAKDGGKGSLTGTGQIVLQDADGLFSPMMEISMDQIALLRRDDLFAAITGKLTLARQGDALLLAGKVRPKYLELRLVNSLPPSVVELEVIEVSRAGPATALDPPPSRRTSIINLDLEINMPKKVYVRGRGVESEWKGNLTVKGPAGAPRISGGIEVARGDVDLIGRLFDLTGSSVTFDGTEDIDPVLAVDAVHESNGIKARILVSGPASKPVISFTSTPSLPEDEILPRVLFGKSSTSLTAGEALQIAQGVATLLNGGSGPLDRARASLGVDVLRLESSGEDVTAPTVSVGKHVSRNVYVGAKQNLHDNTSSAVVEIQIMDNVIVDTEIGDQGQASAGIGWKYDY